METGFTYENKVGKALLAIPLGGIWEFMSKVAPERRDVFIETVKYYMRMDFGTMDGWILEFNGDYTKIKKIRK